MEEFKIKNYGIEGFDDLKEIKNLQNKLIEDVYVLKEMIELYYKVIEFHIQ